MKLSEAIDQYTHHVRAQGLEPRSIRNRTQFLHRAVEVWGDIHMNDIKPVHINVLFESANYKPRTRNLYLGHLRLFFKWAEHFGYMKVKNDPTFGWRPGKVIDTERLRVPPERFADLLEAAEACSDRDRAIVAFGLFAMARGSEITSIKVGDLDLHHRRVHIYRQKTKEEDSLPVSEDLADEMERWLRHYRRAVGGVLSPNWFLFPAQTANKMGAKGGERWVPLGQDLLPTKKMTHPYRTNQRALRAIGYDISDTREGMHTLRRSGARSLFDVLVHDGIDQALLIVAAFLGHKDTKVTAHYIGLRQERARRDDLVTGRRFYNVGGENNGREEVTVLRSLRA